MRAFAYLCFILASMAMFRGVVVTSHSGSARYVLPLFLCAAIGGASGLGLWRQKKWGQLLGCLAGLIMLRIFPIGTVAGIYGLWTLLSKDGRAVFGQDEPWVM